ncbi:MAG: glycine zipper domain-containing protein [Pseudomonadota bacterium]|nr:glycine zipper domain-containing protein [Pseudomonadota bacterium]
MKKQLIAAIVLSAALATPSFAGSDRQEAVLGAIIGGAFGAAIGDSAGGRDGAILGSAIGAATGTAIATRDQRTVRVAQQRPTIIEHQHVYYREESRHQPRYERNDHYVRHDDGRHRGHHKQKHKRHHRDHHDD